MERRSRSKFVKFLVAGNISIYLLIIVILVSGMTRKSEGVAFIFENTMLGVLYVLLILWIFFVCFGLLKYAEWGRSAAVSSNIFVGFILVGLKAIAYIMISDNVSDISFSQYFDLETLMLLGLGLLLIVISIFYMKKIVSQEFT